MVSLASAHVFVSSPGSLTFARPVAPQGIQLVKSLGRLGDAAKQRAEVLVHLKR